MQAVAQLGALCDKQRLPAIVDQFAASPGYTRAKQQAKHKPHVSY